MFVTFNVICGYIKNDDLINIKNLFDENDIELINKYGENYIMLSSIYNRISIINYFLDEHMCDINHINENKQTALHYACLYPNIDLIKFLIENGSDANIKDVDGKTPLMCLLSNINENNILIVRFLLPYSDLKITDNFKRTYLMYSIVYFDLECYYFILSRCDSMLINMEDVEGNTVMLHLSKIGKYTLIEELFELNVMDINFMNKRGWNALHLSVLFCKKETISVLLKNNIDINVKTLSGKTALDIARGNLFRTIDVNYLNVNKNQEKKILKIISMLNTRKINILNSG